MRDIQAERAYDRHQGALRDEYYRRCLDYSDGKITSEEFAAWTRANPIDWTGFNNHPSTPRRPHGGIASVCLDRFQETE